MRKQIIFICIAAAVSLPSWSIAASKVEVLQQQTLLQLGDFNQWASLGYDYSGHATRGQSSASNQFTEKYHIDVDAIVLDPDLLQLTANAEIWSTQAKDSGDGTGTSNWLIGQYGIGGTAYARTSTPIVFSSSLTNSRVVNAFSPTYSLMTYANLIWVRHLNKILPIEIRYNRQTTERTSADTNANSSSTTNTLAFNAKNSYKELSISELNLGTTSSSSRSVSDTNETQSYSLNLTNSLTFDSLKRYTLSSTLSLDESKSDNLPTRKTVLQERFIAHFGKALEGDLEYWLENDDTKGFDQSDQKEKSNMITFYLSHRLFESLLSRVDGSYRVIDYLGGKETDYTMSGSLNYTKKLPEKGKFELAFKAERDVSDRSLADSLLSIRDKLYQGVGPGSVITLALSGRLATVVSVKSLNPAVTYTKDIDYLVDYALGQITIPLAGTSIEPASDLYISYTDQIDNAARLVTDTVDVTTSLSLLNGKHLFSGSLNTQNQQAPSDSAVFQDLNNSTTVRLHYLYNYYYHSLGVEYGSYDSTTAKYTYIEGSWRYNAAPLALSVRNRYTDHGAVANSNHYVDNTIDSSASYGRKVFSWAQLLMSASYVNTYNSSTYSGSGSGFTQYINLRTSLGGFINKLQITLLGQTTFRISGANSQRDDSIHLEIRRFF